MIIRIGVIALFTFLAGGDALSDPSSVTDCNNQITFNYLIAESAVSKGYKTDKPQRQIWVFLDPEGFSESNLRLLFDHLSKKYPKPNYLEVQVETTWSKVPNPDLDCEGWGTSGSPYDETTDKHHWAVFLRRGNNEVFRYNPVLGKPKMSTVLVKGNPF